MNSMRQLGTALLYALVSVVLVVGGLSLALTEGGISAPRPTAKPSPTLFTSSTPEALSSPTAPFAGSPTPLVVSVTATQPIATTQPVTATTQPVLSATPTATLRLYPTATTRYNPTPVRCGPYYGWIKSYTVQQGDTLYHISTLYQTTVSALQVANCLQGTFIYPGELLWVPNVPTITPGATIIPTFASPTTELPTLTPIPYFTETATIAPTPTNTPVTPNP
jgi:hypothetical protein